MTTPTRSPWYREPTMMIVVGVLGFTLISGIGMLTFATLHNDSLVMSDEQYRSWRDEMRATTPVAEPDD